MSVRSVILILALFTALLALMSLFAMNSEVLLDQELRIWGGRTTPVLAVIAIAFAIGVVGTFVVGMSREIGRMIESSRLRKAGRKTDEIEEEYSKALVAVLEGREDEALGHFRAVLERDSRHFNTLIKLGDVLRAQGKYEDAIEFHRKAHLIKEDNTRPLYALVDDFEAKGDIHRARVELGKIIGVNKNTVAAWRKLRALHVKEDGWAQALEAHERVVKLAPGDEQDRRFGIGLQYELAAEQVRGGKSREAIARLRRLVKDHDNFIPAHAKLGEALMESGQESDGIKAWYAGFEATGSPIFITRLEEHYLQREQPLAAIESLKRCIVKASKDTLPRFYLGKLYFRLEMLDDALSTLEGLQGLSSYAPTLHFLLGRIHERRQNHERAVTEYRKVIKDLDLVQLEYACGFCASSHVEWSERCHNCGEWNGIEVNFREEIPLEELGLAPAPIYTAGN
ncbi:MAG: tetratricopeptide repeat protein [Acidobacteriota bacterium]|nr:tetratricopeptide repeat protein [Acidobacteriota bacterium]MDH3785918.1 tetratricopeptide repeat protein [Acidobacteriota bacterium]